MDIHETLRVALRAIRRNKVRSALTMLGVIIGVASVIAMIALGSGARASIDQQIQSQGTALIYLSSGSFGGPGRAHQGSGSVQTLTIEDAEAVAREIPTIARWTPGVRGRSQVIAGNNNWNTQVEGGNEDFLAVRNWEVAEGANFTARDVLVAEKVCLLGATVARTLFPDSDPVGQIIRLRNMPFRVTGVLEAKGQGQWGQDQDDFVLAPWTTVQRKLLGINYIHQVSLTARSSVPSIIEMRCRSLTCASSTRCAAVKALIDSTSALPRIEVLTITPPRSTSRRPLLPNLLRDLHDVVRHLINRLALLTHLFAGHALELPERLTDRCQVDAALRFEVTRQIHRPKRDLGSQPLLAFRDQLLHPADNRLVVGGGRLTGDGGGVRRHGRGSEPRHLRPARAAATPVPTRCR